MTEDEEIIAGFKEYADNLRGCRKKIEGEKAWICGKGPCKYLGDCLQVQAMALADVYEYMAHIKEGMIYNSQLSERFDEIKETTKEIKELAIGDDEEDNDLPPDKKEDIKNFYA